MEIKKNPKNNQYSLVGMSEGKLLALERVLEKEFKSSHNGIVEDLYTAVKKGVRLNIATGTKED